MTQSEGSHSSVPPLEQETPTLYSGKEHLNVFLFLFPRNCVSFSAKAFTLAFAKSVISFEPVSYDSNSIFLIIRSFITIHNLTSLCCLDNFRNLLVTYQ